MFRRRAFRVCSAVVFSVFFFTLNALGQVSGEAEFSRLLEGAKKEGELVFYASMSLGNAEALRGRFQKKYPFLKVALNRLGSGKIHSKVMMEARAKKLQADVIQALEFNMYSFRKNGVLENYISPESRAFPKGFKEEGYWTAIYINPYVIAYNTKLVPLARLPKTYEDLLKPEWKGKMMIEGNKVEWFAGILQIMGTERGVSYVRALAKQDLALREGHSLLIQLIAAGEAALDVNIPADFVEALSSKGAPVDWVSLGPVPTITSGIGVAADAPHPNAAKLFLDFVLSREGQEVMMSFGKQVARSDLAERVKRASELKLVPVNPNWAEKYEELTRQLRTILAGG